MQVVITSNQDIEVPDLHCKEKVVMKTKTLWEFDNFDDAMKAAKFFVGAGFELVRLEVTQ